MKVELKCTHCDKYSVVSRSCVFPKHHPVNGSGYFGKRINRLVFCDGGGVDSRARMLARIEHDLSIGRATVKRTAADIEQLRNRLAEAEVVVAKTEAALAKLRSGK